MKVLLVEDEAAIREVESAYLKDAGFKVTETDDGQKAAELFHASDIDIAVIDINLPSLSGLELCRVIRATSTMPIMLVTARDSDEDEILGLEIGADDYLKKPFNPKVLVARVQALMRNHGGSRLQFDGLTIDPQTMTVLKNNRTITLTTTRFNLLMVLATQPNVVFSRQQLLERIYTESIDHFVYDRTIDAHIKGLRKQIEEDSKNAKYIQTVIGSGYRFIGNNNG